MDAIFAKNVVSTKPTVDVTSLEKGWAKIDGARTVPGAHWYNMMTAEVLNVIDEAGIVPDGAVHTQLYDAIVKLIGTTGGSGGGNGGDTGSTSGAALTATKLLVDGTTIELYGIPGGKLGVRIGSTDYGNRFPIDISGTANSALTAGNGGSSGGGTAVSQDVGNSVVYRGVIPNPPTNIDFDAVLTTGHYSVATPAVGGTFPSAPSTDSVNGYGNMMTLGMGDSTSVSKTLQYPIVSQIYCGFGGTMYHRTQNFNFGARAVWKQVVDTDMLATASVKTAWYLGPEQYNDAPITTTKQYIVSSDGHGTGLWMLAKEFLVAGILADYNTSSPNVTGWLRLNVNNGIVWSATSTGIVNVAQGYIDFTQNGSIGAVLRAQDYLQVSDPRLKEDMKPLTGVTELLDSVTGYSFKWKDIQTNIQLVRGKPSYGVNAEEIETVFPHAVKQRVDGYKTVSYTALVPVLIAALKESNARITSLEKMCASLLERLDRLEKPMHVSI